MRSILSSTPPRRMSHDQNPLFDSTKSTNSAKPNTEGQTGVSGQTAAGIDSAISLLQKPISRVPNVWAGGGPYNPRYPTRHKGIRPPRPGVYARYQADAQAIARRGSTSSKSSNAPSQQLTSDPLQGDEEQTLFIPEAPRSSMWATILSNGDQIGRSREATFPTSSRATMRSHGGQNGRSQEASVRFPHPTDTTVTSGRHAPDTHQSRERRQLERSPPDSHRNRERRHLERSPRSPPQEDATEAKKKQRRKTRFDILPDNLNSRMERDRTHDTGYGGARSQRSSSDSHLLRRESERRQPRS